MSSSNGSSWLSQNAWFGAIVLVLHVIGYLPSARADERVVLKSGIALQGLLAELPTLNEGPFPANGGSTPILMVDDGLRRIYIHRRGMVAAGPQDVRSLENPIDFNQPTPRGGRDVQGIGNIFGVSEFNRYGQRTISLRGPKGEVMEIIQGITEINARYAKLEALTTDPAFVWDMRVATSSIPAEALQKFFRTRMNQNDIDERFRIVRFFIESERFRTAEEELKGVIRDFPNEKGLDARLIGIVQRQATQLFEEAQRRAAVGQKQFARRVFEGFPQAAVGRVMRQKVLVAIEKLDDAESQVNGLLQQLETDVAKLSDDLRKPLGPIMGEIRDGLSTDTIKRLSDYARLKDAKTVPLENLVSLAISGWLMGPGAGEQNLIIATSLIEVRNLVVEYLGTADPARRQAILVELKGMEGAQIEYVSRLLPLLSPVKPWPEGSQVAGRPRFYAVGPRSRDFRALDDSNESFSQPQYIVQLPPEYNPLREYPCLLSLSPPGAVPELELSWWAGDLSPAIPADPNAVSGTPPESSGKLPSGHAMRNGYIVVSPVWSRPGQRVYQYTPREHYAVLSALRHAMRRASIDADKVFITGHGEGATAAWDIALSHPDLWAGMISINGEPSKTIQHYYPNAEHIPMYFVMGELSGPRPPLMRMGAVLDRYMNVRNDAMVVMYRGRGSENFYEEIPELFNWLNVPTRVRKPTPQEFEMKTMRSGDQAFWWLELGALKSAVDLNPVLWSQEDRIVSGTVMGSVGGGNTVRFSGPSDDFTIWLSPEMGIDLNQSVRFSSTSRRYQFDGELETILEDTRQRADRKRPFWAKVQLP